MLIESLYVVGKVTLIPELVEVVQKGLSDDRNTVQCNYSADRLECAAEGAWRSIYGIKKGQFVFNTPKGTWLTEEMKTSVLQSSDYIAVRMDDCEKDRDEGVMTLKSNEELCCSTITGSARNLIIYATILPNQGMVANCDSEVNDSGKPQDNNTVEVNNTEQSFWMNPDAIRNDMEKTLDRMKDLQTKCII